MLGLALVAGGIIGLGLGFRGDLVIAIPPFVAATLFLLPEPRWRVRIGALAAFTLGFLLIGAPVLLGYTRGSNNGRVILLGLMTPFDQPLGIAAPIYDLGHLYLDELASIVTTG